MALNLVTTGGAVATVAGRYVEYTADVNSTTSLAGQRLYFAAGLDFFSLTALPSLPSTGFRIANYAGVGTESAIFYGAGADNNIQVEINKVDNFNFQIRYRFLMSADTGIWPSSGMQNRYHFNTQAINPLYNIYDPYPRKVHVKVFETNASDVIANSLEISDDITATWYESFNYGAPHSYAVSHGASQGKTGYSCTDNTTVTLDVNAAAVLTNIEVMIYREVDETATLDPVTEMDIHYLRHGVGAVNPLLSTTAFVTSSLIIAAPPFYQFTVELDQSYFDQSSSYWLVITYVVSGVLHTHRIPLKSNCNTVPRNVTIETVIANDLTYASTFVVDCLLDIPEEIEVYVASFFDKATYDAEVAALLIGGDFDTNFVGVNYFIVDTLPQSEQPLVGTGTPVDQIDDISGDKIGVILHKVLDSDPYYIVFEWVFKYHKIYNPIQVFPAPGDVSALDAVFSIEDESGDPVGTCFEYEEDVEGCDYWVASFEPQTNRVNLHSEGSGPFLETDIVKSVTDVPVIPGIEGLICFTIDHEKIKAVTNKIKHITWDPPSIVAPTCPSFNIDVFQATLDADRFQLIFSFTTLLTLDIEVVRDGAVVKVLKDVQDAASYYINADIKSLNRFVYRARAYGSGCNLEGEQFVDTSSAYLDNDTKVLAL